MASNKTAFHWDDPLLLDQQLTDEERMVRDAARDYCQGQLAPRVLEMFRHEKSDISIFREMASWACWARRSPPTTAAPA